ncbi:hypothetical protein ABKN59_005560 [Abortiporus biennis]
MNIPLFSHPVDTPDPSISVMMTIAGSFRYSYSGSTNQSEDDHEMTPYTTQHHVCHPTSRSDDTAFSPHVFFLLPALLAASGVFIPSPKGLMQASRNGHSSTVRFIHERPPPTNGTAATSREMLAV